MTKDFTVAIPTYNGAERLPRVLDKLRSQLGTESLKWEIIVVDNNSTDQTAAVVKSYQESWDLPCELTYILETKQGATFARHRAIQVATSELIGFLDDDNLPQENWVISAYKAGINYPEVGAFNGKIHGKFITPPPANFERIQSYIAIRDHGEIAHAYVPERLHLPPGAGLVVRRQAWLDSVPHNPKVLGNTAGKMARGEDYEPLLYMHNAGWKIWYEPTLEIEHEIPPWRLTRKYLMNLSQSCGLATYNLAVITVPPKEKPVLFLRTIYGNLKRIVKHLLRYYLPGKRDLVSDCELIFLWGCMVSPFYRF
jgi:glycosyltransferase involved in cell wall biosynthesis